MTTCSAPGSATPPRRPACCARTCRRPWPTGCGRSSVTVEESDFVGPELRANESDLLYSIPRRPGGVPACLYVLLEHQFAAEVREWPWLPRFEHLLIDQVLMRRFDTVMHR